MTFSATVKEELLNVIPKSRHCQVAELSALALLTGEFPGSDDYKLADRKTFTLIKKTLNIDKEFLYFSDARKQELYQELLLTTRIDAEFTHCDPVIIQQPCCKRAFIRGAFIVAGSVSNPNKGYHFEIVCRNFEIAQLLMEAMNSFEDIQAKITDRKNNYVVYLKEGTSISLMLGIMEAPKSVMEFENARILREMRNSINRKVNCEAANIAKTVSAAMRSCDDIRYLDEKIGLTNLPDNLQEIARLRLKNPESSLEELGKLLDPPLGKSGVNHRLAKLSRIAAEERGQIQ